MKVDGQNNTLRATNPETYKDLKSLFPAGIFQMPMGLSILYKFEELKSVQVNVFVYHKKIYFLREFQQKRIQSNWLLIYFYFTIQKNITMFLSRTCANFIAFYGQ